MTRHILITGANGFLGRHTLNYFSSNTEDVLFCLSRTNPYHDAVPANVQWIPCDLAQDINVSLLPKTIDVILHLAQSNHYRSFPKMAQDMFDVNVASTQKLLDIAYRHHVKHFIFTSTGSIYEKNGIWCENDVVSPQGYYPLTKFLSEEMIKAYMPHFSVCILRLFHLFGPNQQYDRLIPSLVQRVLTNKVIEMRGGQDGPMLCPTYVMDVGRILKEATEKTWSGIYNVASSRRISLKDLCLQIGMMLEKSVTFKSSSIDYPSVLPNLERLNNITDLSRMTSLEDALQKTLSDLIHDQKMS